VLTLGGVQPPAAMAAAIDAVGPDDVAALGAILLAPGRSTVSVLGPRAASDAPARFETALFA
jgi:predicted Zn-dependent peptidase